MKKSEINKLQDILEGMGGEDPTTGDGFVVCTNVDEGVISATAVPLNNFPSRLKVFHKAFEECVSGISDVKFGISPWNPRKKIMITFCVPSNYFQLFFNTFLLYLRQSRVMENPIICCKFDQGRDH